MIRKRSIRIAGHKTSVSLEEEFWDALKAIAQAQGISLTALVEDIDRSRGDDAGARNLSSALRLAVLSDLQARAGR